MAQVRRASFHFEQPRILKNSGRPESFSQVWCGSSSRNQTMSICSSAPCLVAAQAGSSASRSARRIFLGEQHAADIETLRVLHPDHAAVQAGDVAIDVERDAAAAELALVHGDGGHLLLDGFAHVDVGARM